VRNLVTLFRPIALLPAHGDRDFPLVGVYAVFIEVDSLPGAQGAATAGHGDAQVHLRQDGAHVGRHIVGAFLGVVEQPVTVWYEAPHERL